ncbi:MFS transporter [Albimonas sp. CAU 1670]|uniref:MFS transporter n=1 Tax=Albimonas sp. CAU 1670 TaxID=3032599 RepID=UPI0023DC46C5|nr:MFS transporter [Albimonas sp. CAU 1670]MDF2235480.1 MFS transporter [Albimonas sp. CAU 1670]
MTAPDPVIPSPDLSAAAAAEGSARWGELLTRAHLPALAMVSLAVWLHAANSMVTATLIDAMLDEIGGERWVAWSTALYLVGSISASSVAGLAARRKGLRPVMTAAAALFGLGCAVQAMAPTMPVVLAARLAQGVGGGGLVALGFVAAGQLFPRRLSARVVAVISTLWGVSALIGPLFGGAFVAAGSWRAAVWCFGLQAAALALLLAFGLKGAGGARPEAAPGAASRPPLARLGLISAGVFLIAAGGVEVAPVKTSLFLLAGLGCLVWAFRRDAARGEDRMFPPGAFRLSDRTGASLLMMFALCFATVPYLAYGPVLLIRLHGVAPIEAGLALASLSVTWSLAAVVVSSWPERRDPLAVTVGVCLVAATPLAQALVFPEGPVWAIVAVGIVEGAGFGMSWTFVLRRAQALSAEEDRARVASGLPTSEQLGYAAGAAFAGVAANAAGFAEAGDPEALATSARWIFLATLPAAALSLVALRAFVRK